MSRSLVVRLASCLLALGIALPSLAEDRIGFDAAAGSPGPNPTAEASDGSAGEITVTGTREAQKKSETPLSIVSADEEEIERVRPAHPSEIMNRLPGVHVNVTGGEGHMTAIRQPITTGAVYLYLEDGVPSRSTGFFNHNALYELNVPQSGGIEVLKGPGTALYGSDAIGAVINVSTKAPPLDGELSVSPEFGEYGWYRFLASGGNSGESNGFRVDLNLTHTDGWRKFTEYDREAGTFRWDHWMDSGASWKTVLSFSQIDQETAGSSRLLRDDWINNPTENYTPISLRKVRATRLSTAYEKEGARSLFSFTGYLRDNYMRLLPNWSLTFDPQDYTTENYSIGTLIKYRRDFDPGRTRLIVGLDVDHSPGSRLEYRLDPVREGLIFTSATREEIIYDYDVTYTGISPYIHVETSASDRLRFNFGLRYDNAEYDYDTKLDPVQDGRHRVPDDTTVDFDHLSPKFGLTYMFSERVNGFLAYRHAFRVPSESQIFRQGRNANTLDLEPIKVDNYEAGLRGRVGDGTIGWEASVYYMTKEDDILTFRDAAGDRFTTNAGETLHRGVEVGFDAQLSESVKLGLAYSYAKHTYETWMPSATVDYSGNEMEAAPRSIGEAHLLIQPKSWRDTNIELEWIHLGSYFMDPENVAKYNGHDLFNIRTDFPIGEKLSVFAKLLNTFDKRYATNAQYSAAAFGNPEKFEYAPGDPRTFYVGFKYTWD